MGAGGYLAFWASIALICLHIALDTAEEPVEGPHGWTEDEKRTNAWLEAHHREWDQPGMSGMERYKAMHDALEEARRKGEL